MTPDRADWHLRNWARHMRSGQYAELCVRAMSLEAGYSHGQDFEGLCEERDAIDAQATNAVILDLPPMPKAAIKTEYLRERWFYTVALQPLVEVGILHVADGLRKRGIL